MTVLLLTGRPGIGKTTVVHGIIRRSASLKVRGFLTRAVLDSTGRRQGFECVLLPEAAHEPFTLASCCQSFNGNEMVGKYHVNVASIDTILVPYLTANQLEADLLILDEVGKMELKSRCFQDWLRKNLAFKCSQNVIITIPIHSDNLLVQELRQRASSGAAKLITVSFGNRDDLPHRLAQEIGADPISRKGRAPGQ